MCLPDQVFDPSSLTIISDEIESSGLISPTEFICCEKEVRGFLEPKNAFEVQISEKFVQENALLSALNNEQRVVFFDETYIDSFDTNIARGVSTIGKALSQKGYTFLVGSGLARDASCSVLPDDLHSFLLSLRRHILMLLDEDLSREYDVVSPKSAFVVKRESNSVKMQILLGVQIIPADDNQLRKALASLLVHVNYDRETGCFSRKGCAHGLSQGSLFRPITSGDERSSSAPIPITVSPRNSHESFAA